MDFFVLSIIDNVFWLHRETKTACGRVSECAVNTYPAKLVGALHTAHLYVSILSSRDNLHTVKVTGQDHYITTWAIGLEKKWAQGKEPNQTESE